MIRSIKCELQSLNYKQGRWDVRSVESMKMECNFALQSQWISKCNKFHVPPGKHWASASTPSNLRPQHGPILHFSFTHGVRCNNKREREKVVHIFLSMAIGKWMKITYSEWIFIQWNCVRKDLDFWANFAASLRKHLQSHRSDALWILKSPSRWKWETRISQNTFVPPSNHYSLSPRKIQTWCVALQWKADTFCISSVFGKAFNGEKLIIHPKSMYSQSTRKGNKMLMRIFMCLLSIVYCVCKWNTEQWIHFRTFPIPTRRKRRETSTR